MLSPCPKVTAGFAFTSHLKMCFHQVLPERNICQVLFENEFTFHLLMPRLLIRKHCWPLDWRVNQCLFMAVPGTVRRVSLCREHKFTISSISKYFIFNLWMLSFRRLNTIKFSCHFLPCGHFSIHFLHFLIEPHKQVLYFPLQIVCCYFLEEKNIICYGDLV